MAKQIIDLESAGLVVGDLTFDWCKKISNNADVSTAGATLTERGNGIYVLDVTVTEDTDFRIHITADAAKYAVGIFSPVDGDVAKQTILDIVAADVAGLDGEAMRGTDGAYTGIPPTVAAIRAEIDSNSAQLAAIVEDTGTALPALIAGISGLTGAYQVIITVYRTATATPIPDYVLHVYNSTETVYFGSIKTNSLGVASFNRDAGTYKVRGQLFGFVPGGASETVIISDDDVAQTFYAAPVAIGAPTDVDATRIYEYLFKQDSNSKPTTVTAEAQIIKLPYDADGKLHKGDIITGTYDSSTGLTYWDIVTGATVRFKIKDFGIDDTGIIPAPDPGGIRLFGTAAQVAAGTAVICPQSVVQ